jgi:hypothetical protein
VDGSGNVFVADYGNNAVKEILAAGGYTKTLGSGFHIPQRVAVDGSGNVFVADYGNDAVKEILAAGGYTTVNTLGSGFHQPEGVAVEAAATSSSPIPSTMRWRRWIFRSSAAELRIDGSGLDQ